MEQPPDLIELRGLRVTGIHGLLPEERERAQPFEVDVDLEVDMRAAGRSDALSDTVDYGAVTAAVAAEVAGPPSDLLEHLAHRIAAAALSAAAAGTVGAGAAAAGEAGAPEGPGPAVTGVTVAIRKLRPPVPHDLASAGVRIRRRPDDLGPAAAHPGAPADRGDTADPGESGHPRSVG